MFGLQVGIAEPLNGAKVEGLYSTEVMIFWKWFSPLVTVRCSFVTLPEGRGQCADLLYHFQQLLCILGKCTACAFQSAWLKLKQTCCCLNSTFEFLCLPESLLDLLEALP